MSSARSFISLDTPLVRIRMKMQPTNRMQLEIAIKIARVARPLRSTSPITYVLGMMITPICQKDFTEHNQNSAHLHTGCYITGSVGDHLLGLSHF